MITEEQFEQASLYALGALPKDEGEAFEDDLRRNAELRALVFSLQNVSDLLAYSVPQIAAPDSLQQKVLKRLESSETPTAQRPGFHFHAAADPTGWKELPLKGAWVKLLSFDKERQYAVLLGKLGPGVRYPAHTHPGAEELYILTGDLHIGHRTLRAGDFHHSDAGTSHEANYSVEGCTLLAVVPAEHELARFAMA
jgi:quercetin dioxygenase-like cupin family protein